MADDFEALLSTWVLSFDDFVVTEDLEMRLAGEGQGREEVQDRTRRAKFRRQRAVAECSSRARNPAG
jgi:hypothetical protein